MEFLHAWKGYKQFAWGHDGLRPLSNTPYDWYQESLCLTPVDALDTMILMGMTDEATETTNFITKNLSFDKDIFVKTFEVTIRLLGGLLSSYQLTGNHKLLDLADDLGSRLLPAFNSPTGMPYVDVNLKNGKVRGAVSNPAEIGTLMLEFGTLGKLTGKPVYLEKAKQAVRALRSRRSGIGLVGDAINVKTGEWKSSRSHISGGIDSYYEYLLKGAILFDDPELMEMWRIDIRPTYRYLADEQPSGLWFGYADMETGKRTQTLYGSLDAFLPALLTLDGNYVFAARLQKSSFFMWNLFGIEPESYNYVTMAVEDSSYHLRPEIIESAYYLHFFTGDSTYQRMGAKIFQDLKKYCRTSSGYAELANVVTKEKYDRMESFFFAETLKYLYLLFETPRTLDLTSIVFTTEAHPLRRTWD